MGFTNEINWEKLKQQKETLIKLSEDKIINESDRDDITGIIHLIDGLQDWAVDDQGEDEETVFPGLYERDKEELIELINYIIGEHGEFTVADVEADHSPQVNSGGKLTDLMEEFSEDQGRVYTYDPKNRVDEALDEYDEDYYNLDLETLRYVYQLAQKWEEMNEII